MGLSIGPSVLDALVRAELERRRGVAATLAFIVAKPGVTERELAELRGVDVYGHVNELVESGSVIRHHGNELRANADGWVPLRPVETIYSVGVVRTLIDKVQFGDDYEARATEALAGSASSSPIRAPSARTIRRSLKLLPDREEFLVEAKQRSRAADIVDRIVKLPRGKKTDFARDINAWLSVNEPGTKLVSVRHLPAADRKRVKMRIGELRGAYVFQRGSEGAKSSDERGKRVADRGKATV